MDLHADLNQSGVLTGANFDIWKERTLALLRLHGSDVFVLGDPFTHATRYTGKMWQEGSMRTARLICMLISPDILKCLPTAERKDAKRLMLYLERISTHFRFLDLSAEIRNLIYRFVLDSSPRLEVAPYLKTIKNFPAISRVSRQVRSEVLPLFYADSKILFDLNSGAGNNFKKYGEVPRRFRQCLSVLPDDFVKRLADVSLALRGRPFGRVAISTRVEIALTMKHGHDGSGKAVKKLKAIIAPGHKLASTSQRSLDRHLELVSADCSRLGLEHKAPVLAILNGQNVWDYNAMEFWGS